MFKETKVYNNECKNASLQFQIYMNTDIVMRNSDLEKEICIPTTINLQYLKCKINIQRIVLVIKKRWNSDI